MSHTQGLTHEDLDAIERRALRCRDSVNAEGSPMGRMMAWGNAAPIVREDIPALVAEVRRLKVAMAKAEGL